MLNFKKSFDQFLLIKSIWAFYEKLTASQFPVCSQPNLTSTSSNSSSLTYGTFSWVENFLLLNFLQNHGILRIM